MSKYPQRIILNNPEKKVPDDIVQQFFMAIKTGNVDAIRNFSLQYKNKYNLIDKLSKPRENIRDTGGSPFHAVLELDNNVADNDNKLRIMKYLADMGAPMDVPDAANIWPIHLAAALQSPEIVDFFINKKVNINRKDSSNNTPLHYAIVGKETACPKPVTIGSLIPSSKTNRPALNTSLERANLALIRLIAQKSEINDDLIHIINTIMKIPDMYVDDKETQELQKDIVLAFTNTTISPEYSGGLTLQQNKLDQIVESTIANVNDNLLKGLTDQLNIAPNNGGWGPVIPTGNPAPNDKRPPTQQERIMQLDRAREFADIKKEYLARRANVTNLRTNVLDESIRKLLPSINTNVDTYIDNLVFCPTCPRATLGENVGLAKMLYLLLWNYGFTHYPLILADRFVKNFKFIDKMYHDQIMNGGGLGAIGNPGYLFGASINFLLNDAAYDESRTILDAVFDNALVYLDAQGKTYSDCIRNNLIQSWERIDLIDPVANRSAILQNGILGTNFQNILSKRDFAEFNDDFNKLRPRYQDKTKSWFQMLSPLLAEIARKSINNLTPNPSVTDAPGTNTNDIFHDATGNVIIPRTPLPAAAPVVGANRDYTIYEAMRIMNYLAVHLTDNNGDFQARAYPSLYNYAIADWIKVIDEIGAEPFHNTLNPISAEFPEFIFLYKILARLAQRQIHNTIRKCIQNIINRILELPVNANPNVGVMHDIFAQPFSDVYVYGLLLPSLPNDNEFAIADDERYQDLKNNTWNKDKKLIKWFNQYISGIDSELANHIIDLAYNGIDLTDYTNIFDYGNINNMRAVIETDVVTNENEVIETISANNFRNHIRAYFGTYRLQSSNNPDIDSINIIPRYNLIITDIELQDVYANNLNRLYTSQITDLHFLTETYGYLFASVRKSLEELYNEIITIQNIMADIIVHINNRVYYYIPQIFLPALIKQMTVTVAKLINIQKYLQLLSVRYAEFSTIIDITSAENIAIIDLANDFQDKITKQLSNIYTNIDTIATFHNTIIEFLNLHSAYRLVRDGMNKTRLFTMNLIPIDKIPNIFNEKPDFEPLISILSRYRIPAMMYYGVDDDAQKLRENIFQPSNEAAVGGNYTFDTYRNVIFYARTGEISNSPAAGDNLQINIIASNNDPIADPEYGIVDIPNGIAGQWLNFDASDPDNTTYYNSFIGYSGNDFVLNWLSGMPASIRSLAGRHLILTKQKIVENTLQYVIDNRDLDASDPKSTREIFDTIKNIGIEEPFIETNDVRIYVVIAKLVDQTLNRLLNYTIRQSVSNWIYQYISTMPQYANLADPDRKHVDMLIQKDYLKLALNDIDRSAVDKLLASDSAYLGIRLSQIEPFPENLPYSTKPTPRDMVHYLYNINYYGQGDVTAYKRCYNIDPEIASKLITPDTINERNSDGNTALHMAVLIHHPQLVELLIARGANPTSFRNNYGQTPQNIITNHTQKHVEYVKGTRVIDTINNFVIPFNDMLLATLRDEKYANNIVKDITMAIPLQLIMYNHMIKIYLENYQYNFTIEIKKNIKNLLEKYGIWNSTMATSVYPIDIFMVAPEKITAIVNESQPKLQVDNALAQYNRKKIASINMQLELINNQLDGLQKEKQQTVDSDQILFIDNIITQLTDSRTNLGNKLTDLQSIPSPAVDPATVASYQYVFNSIVTKPVGRGTTLTEFYKTSFSKFGKNRNIELGIWNDYFNRDLKQAPSMILSSTHEIIGHIISRSLVGPLDAETKNDLNTIVSFFEVIKKYIETKSLFPQSISTDDNQLLYQEFQQIVYIINLIITPAMRNILLSQIYQGFRETDLTGSVIKDETTVFNEILNTKYAGQTLDSFMYDRLPVLAYKYYTKIYRGSSDPDMLITNSSDIFAPLIEIIKANRLIIIDENSPLISNIRNYLIPYMANTYQNTITKLRLAVYGYERYLLNTYQLVKILQLLI